MFKNKKIGKIFWTRSSNTQKFSGLTQSKNKKVEQTMKNHICNIFIIVYTYLLLVSQK